MKVVFWLKIDEWCKLYKNNLKIQFVLQTFSSKWMLKIIVSNVLWKYNSVFENLMKKKLMQISDCIEINEMLK